MRWWSVLVEMSRVYLLAVHGCLAYGYSLAGPADIDIHIHIHIEVETKVSKNVAAVRNDRSQNDNQQSLPVKRRKARDCDTVPIDGVDKRRVRR
jgi:hypothetical protein